VQILQQNIELNQGKRYLVEFEARTDIIRDITVNIGSGAASNPDPYTSYSGSRIISLDTEMRKYSFEFTMNQPDHGDARCEFNLGLFDSDVILDNVKIIEINEFSDDFETENDPGNWQSSGENCYWTDFDDVGYDMGTMILSEDGTMEIRNDFHAAGVKVIQIDFTYYTKGYRTLKKYDWDLQFSNDGGLTWNTIFAFSDKHLRKVLVNESIIIDSAEYDFTDNCTIRFRSNGKKDSDYVYIDDVNISMY